MPRAGVIGEILYRGYPIERLQALTGRVWPAPSQLIVVAFGVAIMTALDVRKRDLPARMIAHALTDLIGFGLARAQS